MIWEEKSAEFQMGFGRAVNCNNFCALFYELFVEIT